MLQEFYSSLTGKQRLTNMLGYLKGQLGILVRSKVRHTQLRIPTLSLSHSSQFCVFAPAQNPMMRRYAAEAHLLHFDFYNDAFVWRYNMVNHGGA